jgi:hypothetical protein
MKNDWKRSSFDSGQTFQHREYFCTLLKLPHRVGVANLGL